MDLANYIIDLNSSLIDVLKKIDLITSVQTVFVVNEKKQVVGSITDGDVRRGLIKGYAINDPIEKYMFKNFGFLMEGQDTFEKYKDFRAKRLKAVPLLNKENQLVKIYDFSITKSILPIDAMIMAGGKGERLSPMTQTTPKPLLKVGGKEIIAYNFDRLFQYGIKNQNISVNYLGEQLEDYCKSYNKEINFTIIKEREYLGTAGSLAMVEAFENDTVLLMNSDLLTNVDYEDFYRSFLEKDADIMVASIPYKVDLPYAILNSEDGHVSSFKEKPSYTYYANAGIYLMKKELIEYIPKDAFFNATDLLDSVIEKGKKLIHYPIRGYWLDIGKHEDFEKAQKDIAHINWD